MWATSGIHGPMTEVGESEPTDMMKLSRLKNRAIVSDINASPTRFIVAHKKGINVLYANGGAKWVSIDAIREWDDGTLILAQLAGLTTAKNPILDKLWLKLDRE